MTFRLIGAAGPLLALATLGGAAQAAAPADPSGTYLTEDGRARARLEKCGPDARSLCGYVVWLRVPLNDKGQPRVDYKNPDPRKQARPSLGHQFIMGLKPNAEGRYEGKIYNSEDGKSYDVTIWADAPGEITVRGCLIAFLCKSQTWNRVADVLPGQLTGPTNGAGGPRADAEWAPKGGAGTASASKAGAARPAKAGAAAKPEAAPADE